MKLYGYFSSSKFWIIAVKTVQDNLYLTVGIIGGGEKLTKEIQNPLCRNNDNVCEASDATDTLVMLISDARLEK